MSGGEVLLDLANIRLALGGTLVLENLDLQVRNRRREGAVTGQVVALLGPSGVGKTRLLRIIAGLDEPDAGTVRDKHGHALATGSVGYVFQDYPLLEHRTVEANLFLAGQIGGMNRDDASSRAKQLLDAFGLSNRAGFYPAQLSGGQRQRVAIAQQIMKPRELLLMDEPFSGLIREVADLDDHNTVLIVTHDIRAAMAASDTLHMLGRGPADGPDENETTAKTTGARVRWSYDMVERGLAWRSDVRDLPDFATLSREIEAKFAEL